LALVFDQALAKNRTEKDSLTNQVSELKEKLEDLAKALAEARKALSEAREEQLQAQMESTFENRRLLRRGFYDGKTIPHWLDFGMADYNHPFSTVADPRSQYEKGMDSFTKSCRDGNGDIQEGLDFLVDQLTAATPRTTGIPRFDKAITVLRNWDFVSWSEREKRIISSGFHPDVFRNCMYRFETEKLARGVVAAVGFFYVRMNNYSMEGAFLVANEYGLKFRNALQAYKEVTTARELYVDSKTEPTTASRPKPDLVIDLTLRNTFFAEMIDLTGDEEGTFEEDQEETSFVEVNEESDDSDRFEQAEDMVERDERRLKRAHDTLCNDNDNLVVSTTNAKRNQDGSPQIAKRTKRTHDNGIGNVALKNESLVDIIPFRNDSTVDWNEVNHDCPSCGECITRKCRYQWNSKVHLMKVFAKGMPEHAVSAHSKTDGCKFWQLEMRGKYSLTSGNTSPFNVSSLIWWMLMQSLKRDDCLLSFEQVPTRTHLNAVIDKRFDCTTNDKLSKVMTYPKNFFSFNTETEAEIASVVLTRSDYQKSKDTSLPLRRKFVQYVQAKMDELKGKLKETLTDEFLSHYGRGKFVNDFNVMFCRYDEFWTQNEFIKDAWSVVPLEFASGDVEGMKVEHSRTVSVTVMEGNDIPKPFWCIDARV
jgi:hypothetical protein